MQEAERQLLNHVKWRNEENMDNIEKEDWTDFQLDYPLYVDTFDKEGRPAAEMAITEWDVRKAVLSGQGRRLSRWIDRMYELNTRRLYRLRREGKNVTQAVLLADVEGFSFKHGCPICKLLT